MRIYIFYHDISFEGISWDLVSSVKYPLVCNYPGTVSLQGDGPKINQSPFWFILRVLEALILKYLPFKYLGPKIKRECCGALQS